MKDNRFRLLYTCGVIVIAILAALGIAALLLAVLGVDVLDTFRCIFIYPFTSLKNLSGVINIMTPLSFVGIGICVAYRSGITNIGGQGQMYMGILSAITVALALPECSKWISLPVIILAGILGGAVWGAIPAVLRTRFRVSELLSTVMLNYIAIQIFTYCLRVPLLDPSAASGSGEPYTQKLLSSQWLSRLNELLPFVDKNARFHTGVFIAIALAILVWLFMWKTPAGFRMRTAGASARAARYGGIRVNAYLLLAMLISGACCGLAGTVEILGVHHRGIGGCAGNYGFSGIVVALFGGLHPVFVLPAAFFFAVISYGCTSLQINHITLPSNMVDVLMGLVILVIVSAKMVISNKYIMDRVRSRLFAKGGKKNA